MSAISPLSFAQGASVISNQRPPRTQSEILKEKTREEAQKAKQKTSKERNLSDYIAIGTDAINKASSNVPVVYANSANKLNYRA